MEVERRVALSIGGRRHGQEIILLRQRRQTDARGVGALHNTGYLDTLGLLPALGDGADAALGRAGLGAVNHADLHCVADASCSGAQRALLLLARVASRFDAAATGLLLMRIDAFSRRRTRPAARAV